MKIEEQIKTLEKEVEELDTKEKSLRTTADRIRSEIGGKISKLGILYCAQDHLLQTKMMSNPRSK